MAPQASPSIPTAASALLREARQLVRPEHWVEPQATVFVKHHVPLGADVPEDMYPPELRQPEILNTILEEISKHPETAQELRQRVVRAGTPAWIVAIYNQVEYYPTSWSAVTALVITFNIDGEAILLPADPSHLALFSTPEWAEIASANTRSAASRLLREMAKRHQFSNNIL